MTKQEEDFLKEGNYTVRHNLLTREGYSPYCGAAINSKCSMPRTKWNGEQFVCPECGYTTIFPNDFIAYYKQKWNK